jgi:hypothetical protein
MAKVHGVIQGYRITYEPAEEISGTQLNFQRGISIFFCSPSFGNKKIFFYHKNKI